MKRILAIRSGEPEYAEGLARQFNRRPDGIFHTLVFTDEEAYRVFSESNRVDVLLCDEELLSGNATYRADNICRLTTMGVAFETEPVRYPGIFKYQSAENIMNEILKNFNQRQEAVERGGVGHRIFCVSAPAGGAYASTFALALAYYHSRGEKTLFISFDPFFQLPGEEKDSKDRNLTDIIYYLDQGQENIIPHIKSLTRKFGDLDCVSGASHWFDLYDMKPQYMNSLLEALAGCDCYDTVVFDTGNIGAASMEIYLSSDRILVPVKNDMSCIRKIDEWKRQIVFCGQAQIIDKIEEIRIPTDELLEKGYGFDTLLRGRVGRFIEEMEGMQYIR